MQCSHVHVYCQDMLCLSEATENIATEQKWIFICGWMGFSLLACCSVFVKICMCVLEKMHCILLKTELLNSMATKHSKCQSLLVILSWSYSGVSIQYTVVCCAWVCVCHYQVISTWLSEVWLCSLYSLCISVAAGFRLSGWIMARKVPSYYSLSASSNNCFYNAQP